MTNETQFLNAKAEVGEKHIGQLLRINAQMFEGTIRVLSQVNTSLVERLAVLQQPCNEPMKRVAQIFEGTIRMLGEVNTALHEQLASLQQQSNDIVQVLSESPTAHTDKQSLGEHNMSLFQQNISLHQKVTELSLDNAQLRAELATACSDKTVS